MKLHTLSGNKTKSKKRIGRSGKRGTYSGRGQKGQKSRAGRRIRPAIRDLIIRTPKRKGFKNKPKDIPALAVSLDTIQNIKEKNINRETLLKLKILRNRRQSVKILSSGEITDAKEISGVLVSKKARAKIEKVGGSVKK